MLKKLTKQGKTDISSMKLYWDTEKKQIRHKSHCEYCEAETGCMCYDTVDEAYDGVEQGFICDKCWIKHNLDMSLTLEDIINNLSGETSKKVRDFVLETMTSEDLKTVVAYIAGLSDYDCSDDFYGSPCNI
jgi:hypothetical protein